MKNKVIAVFIILSLFFSLFSCSKDLNHENTDLKNTEKNDYFGISIPPELCEQIKIGTDFFKVTVIDSQKLPEDTVFTNIGSVSSKPYIYTVKVTETYRTVALEKDMKVNVVRFISENGIDTENYFSPFEIGKTYIISGIIQLLNDKPVIVDMANITSEIKQDGALVPASSIADKLFSEISNYDAFINQNDVVKALQAQPEIPSVFWPLIIKESDIYSDKITEISERGLSETEFDTIAKIIGNAIETDSKKTIIIPKEESEKQDS